MTWRPVVPVVQIALWSEHGRDDGDDTPAQPVGDLLRAWRERRRLSQLALALDADVSARHLSFLETGRARPSRDMLLRLMERLDVPLRERNRLLLAAGYAPPFRATPRRPRPPARAPGSRTRAGRAQALSRPAVDRYWTLVATNDVAWPLLEGVDPGLLEPPINVLRQPAPGGAGAADCQPRAVAGAHPSPSSATSRAPNDPTLRRC